MKYKNLMARALYDNVPESPEELAFCKGDVLTVLEQNTGGLEGWWLCSLHGRQGIAPGNRLKLLIGPAFEAPASVQGSATRDGLYQVPPSQQGVYQVPQRGGRSAEETPRKVVTPTRVGHSYAFSSSQQTQPDLYDVPPVRLQGVYDIPHGKQQEPALRGKFGLPCQQGVYDIPPTSQGVYSIPPCRNVPDAQEGNYDFPQPLKAKPEGIYDVPPATFAKAPQSNYDFLPSCPSALLRSAASNKEGVYDVPPQQSRAGSQRDVYDIPRGKPPSHERTPDSRMKDVVDGVDRISFSSPPRNAAVRQLALLQRDVSSVSALLASAATPGAAVSTALDRLHAALAELRAIGVTAEAAGDPGLRSLLQRLRGSEQILLQVGRTPEAQGDGLGSVVAVCKSVSDVAQRLSCTLSERSGRQEETELEGGLAPEKIGHREREQCVKSWMEDYDYVHLQGKEEFERQQKELLEKENLLGQEQLIQFKQLEQEVTKPVENDITQWVSQQPRCGPSHEGGSWQCGRDVQLLRFYSEQCQAHFASLLEAMDVFFGCVRAGHPPRVFVAHSKSVILSAHKLVFVGDTLARQISSAVRAERVVGGSNALCQLLKVVVGSTKAAALHYPSTAALQEMVDRVTDLSHQAQQFKAQLLQMAAS